MTLLNFCFKKFIFCFLSATKNKTNNKKRKRIYFVFVLYAPLLWNRFNLTHFYAVNLFELCPVMNGIECCRLVKRSFHFRWIFIARIVIHFFKHAFHLLWTEYRNREREKYRIKKTAKKKNNEKSYTTVCFCTIKTEFGI